MSITPESVSGRSCAGVDWANSDHAVCVLDHDGTVLDRFVLTHNSPGLRQLITRLRAAGVEEVGIERGDGPLVEALLQAGFTVLVIAPGQVKNLRSRYGSAGNKDDRFDAYVLADAVRTDRARLTPLQRDSAATIAMRAMVRARRDLVATRVATCNQLLAHLQLTFPGAIGLFSKLDSPISLSFLSAYASQLEAEELDEEHLGAWLLSVSYSGGIDVTTLHARLATAPRGSTGAEAITNATITRAYVATLTVLVAQIAALEADLAGQLVEHPDSHIFASLPRVATLRTARLIGEIGDARGRFPTPESLAALAGVVPLDPPIGPRQDRHIPIRLQPRAPRRALRLRRRFTTRQSLGSRHLRPSPRTRAPPPARHPDPGPSLDLHHLAMLARQPGLRPRQPQSTTGPQHRTRRLIAARGRHRALNLRSRRARLVPRRALLAQNLRSSSPVSTS